MASVEMPYSPLQLTTIMELYTANAFQRALSALNVLNLGGSARVERILLAGNASGEKDITPYNFTKYHENVELNES